jgi:hypothetical protein
MCVAAPVKSVLLSYHGSGPEESIPLNYRRFILSLVILSLIAVCRLPAQDPIPFGKLAALQALIKPVPGEDAWEKIPWVTDLWQARRTAAERGKPILLWEMDGHPLGCT